LAVSVSYSQNANAAQQPVAAGLRPKLQPISLEWVTFQVMRRSVASLAKRAGVDAHTRSAHMGNGVDVNENEYAVSSFEARLIAVRKLESAVAL
jgi:hypothetical protein